MAGTFPLSGDLGAVATAVAERVRASVTEVRTRGAGAGAGTIWRADGTIVTNHHVVPSDRAEVVLADGRSLQATVVARDPREDLAVLNVDAVGLPAAPIGDARALRAGELVLAVGHPFGVKGNVTIGVVSAALQRGRGPFGERELVRADVLLGPGNSGGPLVDAHGRVVGINAMVNGGLALAVPSHLVERLLGADVVQPRIGIAARDVELPPALAARAPVSTARGALVLEVQPGGAADAAGLMLGDVLVAVNGTPLTGTDGLPAALAAQRGGPIRLGILRGGEPRELVVQAARPERRAA